MARHHAESGKVMVLSGQGTRLVRPFQVSAYLQTLVRQYNLVEIELLRHHVASASRRSS